MNRTPCFVPTPTHCDPSEILKQVIDFARKIQWSHALSSPSDKPRFGWIPSSRWPPPALVPSNIRRLSVKLINGTRDMLRSHQCSSFPCNLTPDDQNELHRLRAVDSVITTADKGGKWTVLSPHLYSQEASLQLSDETFYKKIQEDNSRYVKSRVSQLLNHLRDTGFITKRELNFLLPPTSFQERPFRLLPKLHKANWPNPGMPPGRPIISDKNSITRNASNIVEFFLQPLCQQLPSHLKDSNHLIALLRTTTVSPTSLLFTLDVAALYTNVPIEEGIECVSRTFSAHPCSTRPDATIISLLRLLLTTNTFSFEGERFEQVHGVAMGKCFGGSFANIFLGTWERKAISSFPLRPAMWVRFQDDILGIWDHGTETLHAFVQHLNAQHPRISLSLHFGEEVNFLDLTIQALHGVISYSVYSKDSDTHFILPKDSHHPNHVFKGILFGEFLRFATHSSTREAFDRTTSTVIPVWKSLGYSRIMIRTARRRLFDRTGQHLQWPTGMFKCDTPSCGVCSFVDSGNTFSHQSANLCYPITARISCTSTNVIYLVTCKKCHMQYVGQTKRPLRIRMLQHLRNARLTHAKSPLYCHFRGPCGLQSFAFKGIDIQPQESARFQKEAHWISELHTRSPMGLNLGTPSRPKCNVILPYSRCATHVTSALKQWCRSLVSMRVSYRRTSNLKELLSRRHR